MPPPLSNCPTCGRHLDTLRNLHLIASSDAWAWSERCIAITKLDMAFHACPDCRGALQAKKDAKELC